MYYASRNCWRGKGIEKICKNRILHNLFTLFIDDLSKRVLLGDTHKKTGTIKLPYHDVPHYATCLHYVGIKLFFQLGGLLWSTSYVKRFERGLHVMTFDIINFVLQRCLAFNYNSTLDFCNEVLGTFLQDVRDNEWQNSQKFVNKIESNFLWPSNFYDCFTIFFCI